LPNDSPAYDQANEQIPKQKLCPSRSPKQLGQRFVTQGLIVNAQRALIKGLIVGETLGLGKP
jgi:hypothetical protein